MVARPRGGDHDPRRRDLRAGAAREGARRLGGRPLAPRRAEDGAARLDDRARDRRLRHAAGGARRARRASGRRGRGCRGERPASGRRRHASVQRPRATGHRAGPPLQGVRRLRRHLGQAPGGLRAPRPRRHAGPRGVHASSRGRVAVAAGRARALRELALSRRRGDRPRLKAGRGAGAAAACGRAPGVHLLRGMGGVRGALRAAWTRGRLHPFLVGRAAAPEPRDARDPQRRPAHRARAERRVRRAPPGALRDHGERSCRRLRRTVATTPRTAGPRFASGRAPSSSIRRATGSRRCRSSRRSCSSSSSPRSTSSAPRSCCPR